MSHQISGLGRLPSPSPKQDGAGATPDSTLIPGARLVRVLAQHPDRWLVADPDEPDEQWLVAARGRLRDDPQAPPVTGDWVWLDDAGAIAAIVPREGAIIRRAAGEATRPQVVASGIDVALIVEPASAPNSRRAQRFAALADASGVHAVLVLTKADLVDDADALAVRTARDAGILDGVAVSAQSGDGIGVLRSLLTPGTTAVLLGRSGAGKSTLANVLLGEERQATRSIRAIDGRGRHTTVTRELLRLPWGALLVDTPGVREIGLWDDATDVTFADIATLATSCRFADCQHEDEPGCAVRDVVPAERIAAWRKLGREQAWIDDRRAATQARAELMKGYARQQRAARRGKGNPE